MPRVRKRVRKFDILLSPEGRGLLRPPPAGSAGMASVLVLPQRPYIRRGQRRGFTFGLPAPRSVGRTDFEDEGFSEDAGGLMSPAGNAEALRP
jgi:hypothetical protein